MSEKHRCSKNVYWGSWGRSSPCSRKGVVFEEGEWWCKQHSPTATENRETKRRERHEALDKSSAARARARHVARQWAEVGPKLLNAARAVCDDCVMPARGPEYRWPQEYYAAFNALEYALAEAEKIK